MKKSEKDIDDLFREVDNFLFIAEKRYTIKFGDKDKKDPQHVSALIKELNQLVAKSDELLEELEILHDSLKGLERDAVWEKIRQVHVAKGRLGISLSLSGLFGKDVGVDTK